MPEITPINWDDKVNSPELLAFLQQFGEKYYLSADEINELRDKTNSLIVNRPTDISLKLDRGGYPGTAQDIVDSIHDPVDISGKLDKGGYTGTAKTLKEELELSSKIYTDEESQAVRNYTDTELSFKENLINKAVDFNTINDILFPTVKSVKTQLDTRIPLTEKGIANGVASLGADGKIPNSQIPALAISETFPINSQVAMLALSQADQGDVAVRLDLNKSFILRVAPSSVLENWQELLTPYDSVQSVNGQVGNVNLTTADLQDSTNRRYQTDNQKLFNDATSSIQTQLNSKQPNLGFTPEQAFSKNTAFNKNFGTTGGTVAEGNDVRINNGQTAFSWGNHAGLYVLIGGNAITASKWLSPIALTIGNTYKAVDGSTNVSWSLSEIGAQPLLTNPITGVVGTNYIPKSNGSGLINSVISETGGHVSISGSTSTGSFSAESGIQTDTPDPASAGAFLKGVDVGTAFGQFGEVNGYASWLQSMRRDGTIFGLSINPNGGYVAIGKKVASERLDVNGNVKADLFIGNLSGTSNRATTSDSLIDYVGGNRIFWGWNGVKLTARVNGSDFGESIPINITGNAQSATNWGGTIYEPNLQGDAITYIMTYSTATNVWKPTSAPIIKAFLGISNGSTLINDINGKSSNTDNWNNLPRTAGNIVNPAYLVTMNNDGSNAGYTTPSQLSLSMGLGTNAYNSISYLPIAGGSLEGDLTMAGARFIHFSNGGSTALLGASVHLDGGSAVDFNTYVYGQNPYGIWTNDSKRFEINGVGNSSFYGALGVSGSVRSDTLLSSPLISLHGGGNPYIQFLNDSGGRRAYIQHDGSNLAFTCDIGAITMGNALTVYGNITATNVLNVKGASPYMQFLNNSDVQTAYIQHNGSSLVLNANVGSIILNNSTTVNGTITASGGFFNSDERLKDIISRDGDVVRFTWKDKRDEKTHIGYIAQEVQKTNPDQVQEDKDGILSVNYVELLVVEIQNLKNEIKVMKGGSHGIC